jgi:chromosome segregation ATPase
MHHAMASLRDAREELRQAEDVFKGHRQDAIDHVEAAIKAIQDGLEEQHDGEAALPAGLPSVANLDERYPHMHHALERLKDAKGELENAEAIFGGHRDEAISRTDKAIKQVEDGIHEAEG